MFVLFVYMFVRLQMQKLKKTRRKHIYKKETLKHIKTQRKTLKKRKKEKRKEKKKKRQKEKTGYPAHEPTANKSHKIFAEVRGLDILYFCLLCVSSSCSSSCSVSFCFFTFLLFSPSLFQFVHLQSKKEKHKNRRKKT